QCLGAAFVQFDGVDLRGRTAEQVAELPNRDAFAGTRIKHGERSIGWGTQERGGEGDGFGRGGIEAAAKLCGKAHDDPFGEARNRLRTEAGRMDSKAGTGSARSLGDLPTQFHVSGSA